MERVSLKVAEVKALWVNESWAGMNSSGWGYARARVWYTEEQLKPVSTYRIKGEDGKVYIWATQQEPKIGAEIKGLIKRVQSYKGEEQIVITRCKIAA